MGMPIFHVKLYGTLVFIASYGVRNSCVLDLYVYNTIWGRYCICLDACTCSLVPRSVVT